jgi:hypothetical protein
MSDPDWWTRATDAATAVGAVVVACLGTGSARALQHRDLRSNLGKKQSMAPPQLRSGEAWARLLERSRSRTYRERKSRGIRLGWRLRIEANEGAV